MLQAQASESDLLSRISKARGNSEPEPEPTENLEAVDVSEDEAPEEVIEEAQADDVTDTEELDVTEDEVVTANDDEEELYVEYKGREINLKEIEEWEQGSLRQADYTRKTQEVADARKKLEADQAKFDEKQKALDTNIAELDVILSEEKLDADAIAEMREYEPDKYIVYKEKIEARQKAVSKAKESRPINNVDVEAERSRLWAANPGWLDGDKQTKAFTADMTLIDSYAKDSGYSNEEIQGIQYSRQWQTLLDAAKYREMSRKNSAIEKKVRKAPVTTKPRATVKASLHTKIEKAQAQLKKTGRAEDAVVLRQLKRQLQG